MMPPEEALRGWGLEGPVRKAPDQGNINRTWLVGEPPNAVLQWVNPIFLPEVTLDIAQATERLRAAGLGAPRVVPRVDGSLWVRDEEGSWRLLSYVEGVTLHKLESRERAFEAGRFVGRFHRALDGWDHSFRSGRSGVHDTRRHMAHLQQTLVDVSEHPLLDAAADLARRIFALYDSWEGSLSLPERVCHGDLKVSNLRFSRSGDAVSGVIDLDTIGWMSIDAELGDAWRSWCNPATEDDLDGTWFDLSLFEASLLGWAETAPPLDETEVAGLVGGPERICTELAARFCADSLRNNYFFEDRERYPQAGAHCLARATAQLALAESVRSVRGEIARIVHGALKPPKR